MSRHLEPLTEAELDWDTEGSPRSRSYGDIYFVPGEGLAESEHVFLTGNRLPERFRSLTPRTTFVIGETGFGSGLNVLMAAACFLREAPTETQLAIVSFEKHPLRATDLSRCHEWLPQSLQALSQSLLRQYPQPLPGLHRLQLGTPRIQLTLAFGDARRLLPNVDFAADAWFLDGFAPRVNPDLWGPEFLQAIAAHSRSGTTLATFTAAGAVRRALTEGGFEVDKTPGYGRKRHMLTARLREAPGNPGPHAMTEPPPRQVTVVGAGIAGATLAFQLAARGMAVRVIEATGQIAGGASGNRQGALYIKPGVEWSPHTRLHWSAYQYALRFYGEIAELSPPLWNPCGLIDLAFSQREAARQQRLIELNPYPTPLMQRVSREDASTIAGVPLPSGGLFFPRGGWLQPAAVCEALLRRSGATVEYATVESLPDLQTRLDPGDIVVFATGTLPAFITDRHRPKPIRGQVTYLPNDAPLDRLGAVICGEGYLIPALEGLVTTGASFQPGVQDNAPRLDDDLQNLTRLSGLVTPTLAPAIRGQRAAVRHALPDYLPAAGRLQEQPQIWFMGALGSKGLALAPLLAQWVTDRILGAPPCLESDLCARIDPSRFQRDPSVRFAP